MNLRHVEFYPMPKIILHTIIRAPQEIVFDLSRSIDLHKISTAHTHEEAVAGRMSGLIELGESVTWRAKHLGFYQTLSSVITEMQHPVFFVDELEKGIFKRFRHMHTFCEANGVTTMTDEFDYTSPLGIIGKAADTVFVKKYLTRLLEKRNQTIREFAESEKWREVLSGV